MLNAEDWISKLKPLLSNVNHPIEGMFYLFIISLIFRWRWPKTWNSFLESVSANTENIRDKEVD